jgi:CofH/MqnC C-terminal region
MVLALRQAHELAEVPLRVLMIVHNRLCAVCVCMLQQVVAMHAVARIMLDNSERRSAGIPNIQASWVKEGTRLAQLLLDSGCNDLGGTLMNEVSVFNI